MSIIFDPDKLKDEFAPTKKVERLMGRGLTLKRSALAFVDGNKFLDKKAVERIALKTIRGYQRRVADAVLEHGEKKDGDIERKEIVASPKQLVQRVQNEVVWQISQEVKEQYRGERARWLPSGANEPDPEHQLNYGKTYIIGEGINGEEPGDRYGCQCGFEILVNETELELE